MGIKNEICFLLHTVMIRTNLSKMSKYIPSYKSANMSAHTVSTPTTIQQNTPVYSEYTNELVGLSPIPFGTICDAPFGHPNFGKSFHVVLQNNSGVFYTHGKSSHSMHVDLTY